MREHRLQVQVNEAVAAKPAASTRSDQSHLLTVREVAAMLRLTEKGVYNLVAARRIPYVKISNRVRFLHDDVLAWLRKLRVVASERGQ
jgi:excisionase family DNA binding protein